jgi:type II pantothenate kinase
MSPSSMPLDPATGEAGRTGATPAADISSFPDAARPRRPTVQSDITDAILHPGTVRINVQGAFIVDDEPVTPRSEDYEHDPRDIRLPNHTAVVSHVAVDVSCSPSPAAATAARDPRTSLAPRPSVVAVGA